MILKMLRLYRNCFVEQHICHRNTIQRCSTFATENNEHEPETNFVKLIGTVCEGSKNLPSGSQSVKILQHIKTSNDQSIMSHILTIKPKVLKTIGLKSLTKGHRINVNGYIRSIPFDIGSGIKRYAIAIVPHDITIYNENSMQDICIVMMTAYIESKILDTGTHMSFSLLSHIPLRNAKGEFTGQTMKHSHSVIVADSNVQNYVRTHLTKNDQIFLEGYLKYKSVQLQDRTKRICGNIIPNHIEKIR